MSLTDTSGSLPPRGLFNREEVEMLEVEIEWGPNFPDVVLETKTRLLGGGSEGVWVGEEEEGRNRKDLPRWRIAVRGKAS